MAKLRCNQVWFHSQADEFCFFQFVKQIKAVKRAEGFGNDVFLYVKTPISAKSIRDLVGLFKRYQIDLSELKRLRNKKNATLLKQLLK